MTRVLAVLAVAITLSACESTTPGHTFHVDSGPADLAEPLSDVSQRDSGWLDRAVMADTTASPLPAARSTCAFPMPNPASSTLPRRASYDVSSVGVVVDQVTGLTWQRDVVDDSVTQPEAIARCAALVLNGHDDWRLPTRLELVSLVDFERDHPAIDPAFTDTIPRFYWSHSDVSIYPDQAWYVGFAYGFAYNYDRSARALVRCVRRDVPVECAPTRFQVDPVLSEVVADVDTGLTWRRTVAAERLSWQDAKDHCASLPGGWRLPSMKELQSLVDETRTEGARLDPLAFPDAPADFYWSASPIKGVTEHAWFVNFFFGTADYDGIRERNRALCVK